MGNFLTQHKGFSCYPVTNTKCELKMVRQAGGIVSDKTSWKLNLNDTSTRRIFKQIGGFYLYDIDIWQIQTKQELCTVFWC